MPLTPEQLAREEIDEQLEACGWVVQDFASMNIHAGLGVAVREYPLRWKEGAKTCTGSADYLLYADGRAIGVVEAKPAGYPLRGGEPQSKRYTEGLPEGIPNYRLPLPFAYESTGKITHFTNGLDPDHRSREVFTFHSPEELKRLVELQCQLRSNLREMPVLEPGRLWPVQRDAITNLERSLAANRPARTHPDGHRERQDPTRRARFATASSASTVPSTTAGLPAQVVRRLSGHSPRVGAAQDMIASGIGIPAIMQAGRWKSAQMVQRYGERLLAKRNGAAQLARLQKRG